MLETSQRQIADEDGLPLDELPSGPRTRALSEVAATARVRLQRDRLNPPEWLLAVQPGTPPTDGTNGLNRLLGTWPGDESDEEIAEALRQVS
jgi:hypothetical protein